MTGSAFWSCIHLGAQSFSRGLEKRFCFFFWAGPRLEKRFCKSEEGRESIYLYTYGMTILLEIHILFVLPLRQIFYIDKIPGVSII